MSLSAFLTYFLLQSILWIRISVTLNLPPTQTLGAQFPSDINIPGNISSPSNKSSLVASEPLFRCIGGPEYGDSIGFESCRDAADRLLEPSRDPRLPRHRILTFKDRESPGARAGADVVLPYLSLSRMEVHVVAHPRCEEIVSVTFKTDDGLCAIEITSTSFVADFATSGQVRRAVYELISVCKTGPKVQGGTVSPLGQSCRPLKP